MEPKVQLLEDSDGSAGMSMELSSEQGVQHGDDSSSAAKPTQGKKRALSEAVSDSDIEDAKPPGRKAKISAKGKGSRRQARTTASQRKAAFANDPCIQRVEVHRVQCAKCFQWISLRKSREYDPVNWQGHRQRCSQITGIQKIKVAEVKDGKVTFHTKAVAAVCASPPVQKYE